MQADRGDYTKVVAAEYAAAVVLLGAAPLVPNDKNSGIVRAVEPLARITALSVVFFVLALLSAGKTAGRIAGAFGGLVLLGVVFNARDFITSVAGALSGGSAAEAGGATPLTPSQLDNLDNGIAGGGGGPMARPTTTTPSSPSTGGGVSNT